MESNKERIYFIDDNITYCYPCEVSKKITQYGKLEKYIGKKYTRKEINKVISKLINQIPYVPGSMYLKINVCTLSDDREEFYHTLNFKNFNYKEQERRNSSILFLYNYKGDEYKK